MRGSSPLTSRAGGYSFFATSVPLSLAIILMAFAAAPLACATLSGMSFGAENAPQVYIPGFDVSIGEKVSVSQNLYLLSFMPRLLASVSTFFGGCIPVERTTM